MFSLTRTSGKTELKLLASVKINGMMPLVLWFFVFYVAANCFILYSFIGIQKMSLKLKDAMIGILIVSLNLFVISKVLHIMHII